MWETTQNNKWLKNKFGLTSWTCALQVFDHEETSEHDQFSTSNPWTLQDYFFPQILLQRLASYRQQCLFVQIAWVSVGSLIYKRREFKRCSRRQTFLRKNKIDSVTLFYLCKVPIVNKYLAFLPVTKYNFYAINYIS